MINKKTILLTIALTALIGCGKEKLVIDGERIPVLDRPEDIAADYTKGDIKISLPAPTKNYRWTQSGGNSQHNFGHMSSANELHKVWSKSFGKGSSKRDYLIASPVVAKDIIFTIDANAVVSAHSQKDGNKLWETRLKPQIKDDKGISLKGAGLAYDNAKIFATTGFGGIFALDAQTGEIIWKNYEKTPIRIAPTVGGGKVFVQTIENVLTAYSQSTGKEIWKYTAADEETVLVGGASPAYDESQDILIAGFSNGEVRAIKASTGSPLWGDYLAGGYQNNILSEINAIRANPVIENNTVYVASSNMITAIELRTGQRLWEREFGTDNQPWVVGKVLYVLTDISHLLAMDAESGKIVWDTKIPAGEKVSEAVGVTYAGPILLNNRILVNTSNGYAFYISPYTGEIMGFVKIGEGSAITPVVANEQLIITTTDAKLIAYQ